MKPKLIAVLLLAAVPAALPASGALKVTAVRLWPQSETARVVIAVDGEFQFRSDRLHNPERVYFDILEARPWFAGHRVFRKDVDNKLVRGIRVAETIPGVTRVVLDLGDNTEVVARRMSNPERLIIELREMSAPPIPPPPIAPPPMAPAPPIAAAPPHPEVAAEPPRPQPPEPPKLTPTTAAPAPPPVVAAARPEPPVRPDGAPREGGLAARHTSNGASSLTRALGLKITRVVIDPGHGGHDQGTEGPHGLLEKDLVLDVAQRLGKLIEDRLGSEVIYTRADDTFIPLEGRTALANDRRADLFISIHANSSRYPRIAGVETYYLNFTTAKDALDVAARENASSQKSVFELRDMIQKISLAEKVEESRELAGRVQTALFGFERGFNPGIRNRGVKKAPFVVLIGARMPSVLAEIGFLSNPREENLLKRPEHRQKLAEALFRGISRYADSLSHFQMARAKE